MNRNKPSISADLKFSKLSRWRQSVSMIDFKSSF